MGYLKTYWLLKCLPGWCIRPTMWMWCARLLVQSLDTVSPALGTDMETHLYFFWQQRLLGPACLVPENSAVLLNPPVGATHLLTSSKPLSLLVYHLPFGDGKKKPCGPTNKLDLHPGNPRRTRAIRLSREQVRLLRASRWAAFTCWPPSLLSMQGSQAIGRPLGSPPLIPCRGRLFMVLMSGPLGATREVNLPHS